MTKMIRVKRCKVRGCRFATSHHTLDHMCGKCKDHGFDERGHGRVECGHGDMMNALLSPVEMAAVHAAIRALGTTDGKCYVEMAGCMGDTWYARRNYPGGYISLFFIHSDSWGQYGTGSADRSALDTFRRGYREIETRGVVDCSW